MMMTNSQFGLEGMEVLLRGPTSPMADALDLLSDDPDREELQEGGEASLEWHSSPVSPLSCSSTNSRLCPPNLYSPPPSPPTVLLHGDKVGTESDLLSLHSLGHPGQLRQTVSDDSEGSDPKYPCQTAVSYFYFLKSHLLIYCNIKIVFDLSLNKSFSFFPPQRICSVTWTGWLRG